MKKNLTFYLIAALSLAGFSLLQIIDPPYLREKLESKTYDLRMNLRNLIRQPALNPDIELVLVDDRSLAEIGRWPWSRDIQADLVHKISAGGPKVIGIDIMYTEPENRENDAKLTAAIKKAGNVVLATPFEVAERGLAQEAGPALPDYFWDAAFMEVKPNPDGINWRESAAKSVKAFPPLAEYATVATLGQVANQPDMDGVLRWEIMYVNYGVDCYPSFSLQIARIASKLPMQDLRLFGGSSVELGERTLLTNQNGRTIINYRGKEHTYPYISAADLLKNRVSPQKLHNKIVLLGTSAMATFDQKVTPFSGNFPGVEKNANVVDNILANDFISKSKYTAELITIVVTSLLLIVLLPRLKAIPGVVLAFSLIGSYFLFSCGLLVFSNIWLNFLVPTANMAVIFAVGTITSYVFEQKQSRQIRAMFSSYVTERLVDEMIRNPDMAQLGGQKREVTVLFSDIKSFTTYSENHQPEEVVAILNEYLGAMTDVVLKWEGILDKFIGDAIVVFWGAPMKQEDHAERAVRCALEMQERLDQLRRKWEAEGRSPLASGIGLNSGEAIVGNIGAQGKKMDYTVIGDHVNLGARVEGLTRRYDARILMTEYTLEKLRPTIAAGTFRGVSIRGLERVIVKGKDTPVGIYALDTIDSGVPTVVVECDPEKVVRLTEK
ncbi:MAG: adenylate/guanylate cyclase domain-containing protein [Pelobacteraceae bacterium]